MAPKTQLAAEDQCNSNSNSNLHTPLHEECHDGDGDEQEQPHAAPQPRHTCTVPPNYNMSLAALCLCSLANGIIMVSVFPYSGYMVLHLMPDATTESVGTYAGFLSATFMVGRFFTAYSWGRVADVYGRVVVLQASMLLSAVFSILFGLATSMRMAILFRTCLGMSNAIAGTAKTLASEIGHGDEVLEKRAMGLVVGMRSWGFLLGPAIGGLLADPIKQYPSIWSFTCNRHWVGHVTAALMTTYPFILPNIAVAIFCILAAVFSRRFVMDTAEYRTIESPLVLFRRCGDVIGTSIDAIVNREKDRSRRTTTSLAAIAITKTMATATSAGHPDEATPLKTATFDGTQTDELVESCIPLGNQEIKAQGTQSNDVVPILHRKIARDHFVVHWSFSFLVSAIDEAFPLFCMTQVGLGYSEKQIGVILAISGLIFTCSQYIVYNATVNKLGVYNSIPLSCILGIAPYILIPASTALGAQFATIWVANCYLILIISACKIMTSMCFATLAIATNKTVPASQRARMNGIVQMGGSVGRGAGPIFAGWLCTTMFSNHEKSGSGIGADARTTMGPWVVFGILGSLSLGVFVLALSLRKYNNPSVHDTPPAM